MDSFFKQVIAFLIVLGPLIILHEIGHFWFAKRAGIRVQEFGLGFPPRARKLWRGMGRLRIASTWVHTPRNFQFPAGLADGQFVNARSVEAKGRLMLQSIELIDAEKEGALTTPLKELSAEGVALRGEVSNFDPGTEYSLNWLPIGGFVRMLGEEDPTAPDSFAAAPKRWRAAVLLGGPGANAVAALIIFVAAFLFGQLVPDAVSIVIEAVAPGSPAEQAGLVPGATILAVAGTPVDRAEVLTGYTEAHLGQMIPLTVRDPDGRQRTVEVYARTAAERPADQRALGVAIGPQAESYRVVYPTFGEAATFGFAAFGRAVNGMIALPGMLISGQISPDQARPIGPAGIAQMTSYALDASRELGVLFPLLNMAGVISVALAVTNLLPLPALDGGRLVFVLIEAVRRKRISPEKEALVHFAGMVFLLAIAVLITIQDFSSPIPNPF
ncbi:MAG TPA: M50 family metallopeptidase [Anaerolineae bacterium]|nr:M50 family metallopeptidase [Anaerolineae bacterium]